MENVWVPSGGLRIAADLSIPEGMQPKERRPALVVGHGFGIVKQSLLPVADFFCRAGYVVLAIDYRSFGESEGEPRGQLFPLNEVEDFRNGISYLQRRPEVDPEQVGIWGASFGGAIVIWTAAQDQRVKAVVAEVPVVNGRRWMQALQTSAGWEELQDRLEADRRRRYDGNESERVPPTQRAGPSGIVPMDERTMRFFTEYAETSGGEPLLVADPEITLESIEKVIEFNPESVIHQIAPRPLRIVTTGGWDVIHILEHIQDAYKKAREPKSLVLIPCGAYDIYPGADQTAALEAALELFAEALPVGC